MDFSSWGLYPALLVAGFLGSLVYIGAQPGPPKNWWEIFSPIISAVPTANYLAYFSITYFFGKSAGTGTGGFIGAFAIGVGGPLTARAIIKKVKQWNLNGRGASPT